MPAGSTASASPTRAAPWAAIAIFCSTSSRRRAMIRGETRSTARSTWWRRNDPAARPSPVPDLRNARARGRSARSDQAADALRRRLRAPRHAVALGVSAYDRRIPAAHDARQLRALRKVSPLHLQLQRRQSLPDDARVLPGRLRDAAEVGPRRALVSGRLVDGGERRQLAVGGVADPPGALRLGPFPARARVDKPRVQCPRLLLL